MDRRTDTDVDGWRSGPFTSPGFAQDILAEFSGTEAVLPALDILIASYKALGLSDMEQQVRSLREQASGQTG